MSFKLVKSLGQWIPNPGVLGWKPVGGSKFNLVPETPGDWVEKDNLSPCSGSVELRQLNPINKNEP